MDKNNGGFTLVELVVAIVIFGIVMMAMVGMVHAYQNYFDENQNTSYDLQNANLAMMSIIREMRTATTVVISGDSTTANITVPNGAGGTTAVTYQFTNGVLTRNNITVTDHVVGSFVPPAAVNFNVIVVNMTVTTTTKSGTLSSVELRDSVRPRNMGNSCF